MNEQEVCDKLNCQYLTPGDIRTIKDKYFIVVDDTADIEGVRAISVYWVLMAISDEMVTSLRKDAEIFFDTQAQGNRHKTAMLQKSYMAIILMLLLNSPCIRLTIPGDTKYFLITPKEKTTPALIDKYPRLFTNKNGTGWNTTEKIKCAKREIITY